MKNLLILMFLIFLCFPGNGFGKEIKYKVADIPKELKENARSVVRLEKIEFEVKSTSSAVARITRAITILNNNGIDDAEFHAYYNKFQKISGITGKIYNELGELVKRIPGDQIIDHSAISGFSLYEDYRGKYIDPKIRTLPFTVEYSYEINFSSLLGYLAWDPVPDYNVSVENSEYKLINPIENKIRIREINIPTPVKKTSVGNSDTYIWEAHNLKAYIYEPLSIYSQDFMPNVSIVPENFEYGGHEGNQASWQSLGNWEFGLQTGKNNLSEEAQNKIKDLVKGANSDFEKIKTLYEFMQNTTRYVNVTVGLGGLEPIDAETVNRLSYGDCKALTNYMKSMLDVIGIKSYYTGVYGGNRPKTVYNDLPSQRYFNHVFLCVPMKTNDTLWLECTNQRLPCGYTGNFTDDREAFLIDKDHSKLVHTNVYTAEDNLESRKVDVKLFSNGNGTAVANTCYKGLNYEKMLALIVADDVDKKRSLNERIHLPKYEIANYSHTEHRDIIPSVDESLTINFENYGTIMGERMLVPLNILNKFQSIPERVRNRKTEFELRRAYTDVDTVIYTLPGALKLESLPKPVNIESPYLSYSAKTEANNNQVIYTRKFVMHKGRFAPEKYAEFLEFLEQVSTADRLQFSLIKM